MRMPGTAWLILIAAAVLEVTGDAVIRKGLRGGGLALIALGFCLLGCYGLVVNRVPWDFSRLLGVYIAVFATVSVLYGRFVFAERIPASTWVGMAVLGVGAGILHFGPYFHW
jgi:small multidrug resistance family-3 protein